MSKKTNNIILEQIAHFSRWYDGEGNEYMEDPEDNDDIEFSYGDFLKNELGITVNDNSVRIDMRSLMRGLKKYENMINDPKYLEVDLVIDTMDGYFDYAELVGKREETEEDIRQRQLEKEKEEEKRKKEKEEKRLERERKKLEKLKKEIEKYKDKL